jgi:quercetin dioxygenase-like cupin family protein
LKIIDIEKVPAQEVAEGAKGVKIRWVIDRGTGAPNFAMRVFDIEPGGYTPLHRHDWEHEIYVIGGKCTAVAEDGEHDVPAGAAVFVPGNDLHQFRNTGGEMLKIMCLIPSIDKQC